MERCGENPSPTPTSSGSPINRLPPIVGLTGGIASGKSTISQLFTRLEIPVLNADQIGRSLLEPDQRGYEAVRLRFGTGLFNREGTLDRRQLRQIIFDHPSERIWLEQQLQPLILAQLQAESRAIADTAPPPPYLLWEVPLLLEAGWQLYVCQTIVVDLPSELQLERLCRRDQLPLEAAKQALTAQMSRQERLAAADEILDSSQPLAVVEQQVIALHQRLLKRLDRSQPLD